jgi:hypothetical protein
MDDQHAAALLAWVCANEIKNFSEKKWKEIHELVPSQIDAQLLSLDLPVLQQTETTTLADLADGRVLAAALVDVDPDAFADLQDLVTATAAHDVPTVKRDEPTATDPDAADHHATDHHATVKEKTKDDPGNGNWILRYTALKRIHKAILQYVQTELGVDTAALPVPNLNAAAKTPHDAQHQLASLLSLVVYVATQSARNIVYIERIQTLPEQVQHALMSVLEGLLQRVQAASGNNPALAARRQSSVQEYA